MRANPLFIVLLAMFGNFCEASAQVIDVAGVLPGDRWVYEVKDEITGDLKRTFTVVVLDVSEKEINTRMSVRGAARPFETVFDRGWSRIDDGIWKFKPSDGAGVQTPLQVGKEWRFENKSTHANGTALSTTGQSKVVGEEKVTTSAGTFDTFKIETRMRHVNANDQTKASTVNTTLWYAPTVNRWVRKTYETHIEGRLRDSHTEELTDYSRKP
jgi:hypothetical protein